MSLSISGVAVLAVVTALPESAQRKSTLAIRLGPLKSRKSLHQEPLAKLPCAHRCL